MLDSIVQFLESFPRELATIILSALPITELRLAIPVAIHTWQLRPLDALGYALLGNLIPLVPLYFGLNKLRSICEKYAPWLTRLIDKSVTRAERKVSDKYAKYGALALFLFTALPLPLTGLWTATLAAVALKIPFKYAAPSIILGVIVAGIIVTIL
ncbi:small multi-drug export protein, partial [Patescibacteria group bacterium]|nr:small multi-drug export protein [Patescibacteria group bacterium]